MRLLLFPDGAEGSTPPVPPADAPTPPVETPPVVAPPAEITSPPEPVNKDHEAVAGFLAGLEKYAPLGEQFLLTAASNLIATLQSKLDAKVATDAQLAEKNKIAASLNPSNK